MFPSLLLFATLGHLQTPTFPDRPRTSVAIVDKDALLVISQRPISEVFISNVKERYGYFVDYSRDRRRARITIRTKTPLLKIVVNTDMTKLDQPTREITARNPCRRRVRR